MERFVFLLFFDLCFFSGCYQRLSCSKERVKSALFICFPQKVMPSLFLEQPLLVRLTVLLPFVLPLDSICRLKNLSKLKKRRKMSSKNSKNARNSPNQSYGGLHIFNCVIMQMFLVRRITVVVGVIFLVFAESYNIFVLFLFLSTCTYSIYVFHLLAS